MLGFADYLIEGPHDPAAFKAVFMAGGPGSGKSYVIDRLGLQALGFSLIDADAAFVHGLTKAGLPVTPEVIGSPEAQALRGHTNDLVVKSRYLKTMLGLGLIIDGTGRDFAKYKDIKDNLEHLGYDTIMVFVNTDLATASARNQTRSRVLPDHLFHNLRAESYSNLGKFQRLFNQNMIILDNSAGQLSEKELTAAYKRISAWSRTAPKRKH